MTRRRLLLALVAATPLLRGRLGLERYYVLYWDAATKLYQREYRWR